MTTHVSHSLEETTSIAREWLQTISAEMSKGKATVVGLSGHLGAGKTAFVKAVAAQLGITEDVTSPTFVIMKNYLIVHPRWKKLVHIDAYRLEAAQELEVLDFAKVVGDPDHLVLIEWPDIVKEALAGVSDYRRIDFAIDASGNHTISL
jgi:tRNA threonylcarbamoyladenosine biosynthesis protein TsaE